MRDVLAQVVAARYNRVDMPTPLANMGFLQKPFTELELLRALDRTR